jgi:hypothetical protein
LLDSVIQALVIFAATPGRTMQVNTYRRILKVELASNQLVNAL